MIPYSIPLCTIFTKWPAPFRAAVVEALLAVRRIAGASGRARRGVEARADRGEDRAEPVDDLRLAADHQAEAALEAPDAAARADVDVVDAFLLELLRVANVVVVVGVAAVDDRVAGLEHLGQRLDRLVGDLAGGNHHPGRARLLELGGEVRKRLGPDRAVCGERLHRVGADVVADAVVPVADQPPNHAGAHPAEPDHSELHGRVCGHDSLPSADFVTPHTLLLQLQWQPTRQTGKPQMCW